MNRLHNYWSIAILLGYLFSSNWLSSAQPPSLMGILAPIQDFQAEEVDQPPVEANAKTVEKEVVEIIVWDSIELNAVLGKLEEVISTSLEEGSDLTLDSTATWKPIPVEKGREWNLVLKNNFFPDTAGCWYASFDILVDNETIASRNLRVDASLYKEVWITSQRYNRGESPNESGIQPILRDVFHERGTPVPATADLNEYELVRSVTDGHLLNWNDLKVRPSVRRGNLVDVVVRQGNMTVTMRGRSLEDGRKGENITIRNLSSNRELIGKVVGIDQVQFTP